MTKIPTAAALALLLYALTSNPFVHIVLGFRGGPHLGLFTFLRTSSRAGRS